MENSKSIVVVGAREHNLKNISVEIPRNELTVITGLSGSGKSSLAFDTLYAEGQRRYVESVSAYARQFLNQMHKPDVDHIDGLSPAISIEQRTAVSNPRSTVATTTEIHDYLRLLFAHIGKPHCPKCGSPVQRQTAEKVVDTLMRLPVRTRLSLLAPLVLGRKGRHEDVIAEARKDGFIRLRIDGEVHEIESVPELEPRKNHRIEVIVDRLIITSRVGSRLTDSVELALSKGNGTLIAIVQPEGKSEEDHVFSEKHACMKCGISFAPLTPRSFSFNSPYGACATCAGLGTQLIFDIDLIIPDANSTLNDGAIRAWKSGGRRLITYYRGLMRGLAKHYGFSLDAAYNTLDPQIRKILLHGSGDEEIEIGYKHGGVPRRHRKPFEGVIPNLERRFDTTKSEYTRQRLRAYMNPQRCPTCNGARLRPEVTACVVSGRSIVDVTAMSTREALGYCDDLSLTEQEEAIAGEVLSEIKRRLGFLNDVGLDYLTLDRESGSLSGGELQRIRLATQIGSGLTGVLYVLDEPTVGLHVRDNERLIRLLGELRDVGNTIVVVEHDAQMIRCADYVIDLGPGAGQHGGHIVCAGHVEDIIAEEDSLTGHYLANSSSGKVARRRARGQGSLRVIGAEENNLKNIDVTFPLGLFICVTGVSGSGKSTLVDDILRRALFRHFHRSKERPGKHRRLSGINKINKVVVIDQSPIGRTPRSNPATYTGAFSAIRDLFARTPTSKVRGYGPGRYSFNVKGGRCEVCKGDGILRLEMHFLPDVYVPCETCSGKRYNSETLAVHYHGKNICEILEMTIDEALEFFKNVPTIERKLRTLSEVGLGYLQLGQSATTLSGGEAQRIKLSSELSKQATGQTLYLLDEPTTGLHFADIRRLLTVLNRLRDAGNTVVVIEHNLDVIRAADHIIDLGPEGGDGGGSIVVEGTPEKVATCKASYTGRYLKEVLG